MEPKVFKIKVSLLGDGAVGKTSLIKKYVYDEFEDKYLLTLGAKTILKKIDMVTTDSKTPVECNLMIWDIMGQKEFERLHKTFFRGTKGAFIVTDYTRRETLESVEDWIRRLFEVTGPIPMVFIINKSDLADKAEFKKEELDRIAQKYGASVYMSSAKTGVNVEQFFYRLAQMLVEKSIFEKVNDYDPAMAKKEKPVMEMDRETEPETTPAPAPEDAPSTPAPKDTPTTKPISEPGTSAPPAATAKVEPSLPLIEKIQAYMDSINSQWDQAKREIRSFEEEKAKFQREKDEFEKQRSARPLIKTAPSTKDPGAKTETTVKTQISWED
jgi:small GTP-binding protein